MKALIMDEERHLIVKDMPKPQEKDENIIIKVEAASICGTDMRTFLKGNAKIDPPRILGHECAGTIIHAGSLAKEHGYHEGERVTVAPAIGCGQCPACKKRTYSSEGAENTGLLQQSAFNMKVCLLHMLRFQNRQLSWRM